MNGKLISVCAALDNSILAFSAGLTNMLHCHAVVGEVDGGVLLELGENVVDEDNVEVLNRQDG